MRMHNISLHPTAPAARRVSSAVIWPRGYKYARLSARAMFWLWDALRIRGRVAAFLAIGAAAVVFLPNHLGAEILGFNKVRESGFAWIAGIAFLFFLLLSVIRVIDAFERVQTIARKHDYVILALTSLDDSERSIMQEALRARHNTVTVEPTARAAGKVLKKKGLLDEVSDALPFDPERDPTIYVIPPRVWSVMIGGRIADRPTDLPTRRASVVRMVFNAIGFRHAYERPVDSFVSGDPVGDGKIGGR